ncbi:MAG: P1 family peptidase [Syntrophobacteraceae bacterium]|nr:P1 family peptidase [Syntrophobacteraceae bacterium]
MENDTITAIEGIRVGHAKLESIPSGCTVILPRGGAIAGVDIRGGAPGTYGTDTLNPVNLVDTVNALFFSGGSAFGLSCADGVREYLRERKEGFATGHGVVPIVSGAIIFDLGVNTSGNYPGAQLGAKACRMATSQAVEEGGVGAGSGATVAKLFGFNRCVKAGIGSSLVTGAAGLQVGALIVVNAFGEVYDPATGALVAGARSGGEAGEPIDTLPALRSMTGFQTGFSSQNTVVGAIATNALFSKVELTKVAQMAHDGLARTVFPAHTQYDGDTLFALSCGNLAGMEVSLVGALAVIAVEQAILRGVRKARSIPGIPGISG